MLLGEEIRSPAKRSRMLPALRGRIHDIGASLGVGASFVPAHQSDVDRVHAFRLLVHSEIQAFLDRLATLLLDKVEDRSRQGVLTHAGHHLLVYYSLEPLRSPASAAAAVYPVYTAVDAVASHAITATPLNSALTRHRKVARLNSAVKAGSVKRLLLPLGFRETMLQTALLSNLDSLGDSRNTIAHQSGLVGMSSLPTGSAEWARLLPILSGLDLLERYAPRLLLAAEA